MRNIDPTQVDRLIDEKVRIIQQTWFNYQDRTIFNLLKMAIRVLEQVEARLIVRRLCPKEWTLLNDKAFDLNVKFRLSGEYFPPTVVYKFVVKNPTEFNLSTKIAGGQRTHFRNLPQNGWRELTIEPLAGFMPDPAPRKKFRPRQISAHSRQMVPSRPGSQYMIRRGSVTTVVPAYFTQYLSSYFTEDPQVGNNSEEVVDKLTADYNKLTVADHGMIKSHGDQSPAQPTDDLSFEINQGVEDDLEGWAQNLDENTLQDEELKI